MPALQTGTRHAHLRLSPCPHQAPWDDSWMASLPVGAPCHQLFSHAGGPWGAPLECLHATRWPGPGRDLVSVLSPIPGEHLVVPVARMPAAIFAAALALAPCAPCFGDQFQTTPNQAVRSAPEHVCCRGGWCPQPGMFLLAGQERRVSLGPGPGVLPWPWGPLTTVLGCRHSAKPGSRNAVKSLMGVSMQRTW